jgi:hypothetical protein
LDGWVFTVVVKTLAAEVDDQRLEVPAALKHGEEMPTSEIGRQFEGTQAFETLWGKLELRGFVLGPGEAIKHVRKVNSEACD